MTAMSPEEYQAMMVAGGRLPEGVWSKEGSRDDPHHRDIATSHIPAVSVSLDNGKTAEPYWAPAFAGYGWARQFERD